jgi:hypothetical protein
MLDCRFRTVAWPGASSATRARGKRVLRRVFELQWSVTLEEARLATEEEGEEEEAEAETERQTHSGKKLKTQQEKAARLGDARQESVSAVDFFGEPQQASVTPAAEATQDQLYGGKTAEQELQEYFTLPSLSMATNTLHWWKANQKDFPRLARMAREFLATPATSACLERSFSAAGLAFDNLRQAMAEGNLEKLMWAKVNPVNVTTNK